MPFGNLIQQARKKQKISKSELFFRSGVSTFRIGEIESGETGCTLKTAFALAKALGIKTINVE